MGPRKPGGTVSLLLRVGLFAFLSVAGLFLFPVLMVPAAGYLVGSVMGAFTAAAVANAVALRIYERGRLADIGLGWTRASRQNLFVGIIGGCGAASLAIVPALATGMARLRPEPEYGGGWPAVFFVTLILLFGAFGEEMLFRGYGFQVMLRVAGPFATILPVSLLFALAHTANQNATLLALANTAGWGVILGVAFLRSGDLWLPVGLHFGWNWALPMLGANLSGFKMGVTGYVLEWRVSELWSGGAYGPEGGLFTSTVLGALAVYLWKAPIEGQQAYLVRSSKEGA